MGKPGDRKSDRHPNGQISAALGDHAATPLRGSDKRRAVGIGVRERRAGMFWVEAGLAGWSLGRGLVLKARDLPDMLNVS